MLSIRFLGDHFVACDDVSVAGSLGRRGLELMGYLAVHAGAPLPRQQVASHLWPDSSTSQALTNLRGQLHHIRAVLGKDAESVKSQHGTIEWLPGSDDDCDVIAFRGYFGRANDADREGNGKGRWDAATRAVDVYRGDFLPVCSGEWSEALRKGLHRDCVKMLDFLSTPDGDGDTVRGVASAERRIELEPFEEGGYRNLMMLQSRNGDRAAALRTYHRCASLLDRELGVAPSQATIDLYESLTVNTSTVGGTKAPGRSRRSPLVGRQAELRALRQRWESTLAGSPGLHIVMGEAGVGKSRLLAEFANQVDGGTARVLKAGCTSGQARPLAPVSQWLSSPSLRGHLRQLEPSWRTEVGRLLNPDTDDDAVHRAMVNAWQRRRFIDGLVHGVMDQRTPTLLILDDLQWCDRETTHWIESLLRADVRAPVLVLASWRTEEVSECDHVLGAIDVLSARDQVSRTPLWPLTRAETATLASRLLDIGLSDGEVVHWQDLTGGYPLFVVEYARIVAASDEAGAPIPSQVHAILQRRLKQLSSPARAVAAAAACLRQDVSLDVLAAASGLGREELADAVDELWRRRVFRAVGSTTYAFTHELLREAAYELYDDEALAAVHRQVAFALEAENDSTLTGSLAEQYMLAGEPREAIRCHQVAAGQSASVFANQDAIAHFSTALELLPTLPRGDERDRTELSLLRGMSAPLTAQYGFASQRLRRTLERSASLAESEGQTRELLQSLVCLFAVRFVQGDIEESLRLGARALSLSAGFDDVAGQAHFAYAGAATTLGDHQAALPHFEECHRRSIDYPPSLVGTRPEVHGRAWSAHTLWLLGRTDESLHWSDWAITQAEEANHPYSLAVALAYAAMTHQMCGDRELTAQYARRTTSVCEEYDFAYYREWAVILAGWSIGGHAGVDQISEGLRALKAQGALVRQPYFLSVLAQTWMELGDRSTADAILGAALTAATEHHDAWWVPEIYRLKASTCSQTDRRRMLRRGLDIASLQNSQALTTRIADEVGRDVDKR